MRSRTLFASNPNTQDVEAFKAEAAQLIKSKLEVDFEVDPREPMTIGELAALCRGLELDAHERATFTLPTGEVLRLMAVRARESNKTDAPWVQLGNEVRLGDRVVAQRLRSPEASQAFKSAATNAARFEKSANLFLASWRDETIVDRETARKTVTLGFLSDMTAGITYRLSWYTRDHGIPGMPGHVDVKPALPLICEALDKGDAEAKAKADAEAAAKAEALAAVQSGDAGVTELRAHAKALGIVGASKLRKQELLDTILAGAGPEPMEVMVTPEEMKFIAIAMNLATRESGQGRLRVALAKAGVRVDCSGLSPTAALEKLISMAKKCYIAETVGA